MPDIIIKPTILVFAGPNGSGKSTITKYVVVISPYINADDVKKSNQCSDLDAAIKAEELREKALSEKSNFTFETVLSTERNLILLKRAKEHLRLADMMCLKIKLYPVLKTLISTEISTNYIPINGAKIRSTTDKYSHYKSYSQFLP